MHAVDIIVPVKNEAANILSLVERIDTAMKKAGIAYRIIFVDDRSTDTSVSIIKSITDKYPIILHHKKGKPGKAYCILEGAALATAEAVVMIDADLQYPPEVIPQMLKASREHGVVIANRKVYTSTITRRLASRAIAFTVGRVIFNLPYDIQSGLKLFRREIIGHISSESVSPWALDIPLLYTARELGYSIGTVDITFARRAAGESKINHVGNAIEILTNAVALRLRSTRMYHIAPERPDSPKGAGVIHQRKRFITHSLLPANVSAIIPLSNWQQGIIAALLLIAGVEFVLHPLATAIALTAFLSAIYFIDVLFNLFLVVKSLHTPPEIHSTDEEIAALDNRTLPVYTVLCPLYKEAHVLPQFLAAIQKMDWPKNRLDVQLLLEADDTATIAAARDMDLPGFVRITVVPDSQPKTKPKACNYGLLEAKGEFVVIYDAEDMPDPLQLKKAYIAFMKSPPSVVCLQAKLNYYNPHYNWLTRFFTAEYSLWFDVVLNGLQSIDTAIPLGGTSNHFRTRDLINLHAWDPFNVTEDCDLGVRLFQHGYKTAIIDSTTLEEANSNFKNWIRQRSRWIKGYIQTYFVHMRDPIGLVRRLGVHALYFQLIVGGKIAFMLINPFLWVATIAYFTLYRYVGPTIESIYPTWVFYMAAFSLAFGNFLFLYYYMVGTALRGHWSLIKFVLFIPLYWLMVSIAAAMALFQFIVKPHYWEKTIHGYHLLPKKKKQVAPTVAAAKKELPKTVAVPVPVKPREIPQRKSGWGIPIPVGAVFTGGSILIIATIITNGFNFLYNAYLSRVLNLEDVGLVSLFGSFQYISQILIGAFSATATYRSAYLLGKHNVPATAFWSSLRRRAWMVSLILAAIWATATPALATFFQSDSLLPFFLFTPVWVLGIVAAVDGGFLSGSMKFIVVSVVITLEAVTKFLLSVIFVRAGLPHYVYAAVPLSMLASFSYGWAWIAYLKQSLPDTDRDADYFPSHFFTSALFSRVSGIVMLSLDVILVKHYLPPVQAGEYALISLVGKMVYFCGSMFSQFITPLTSKEEGAGRNSNAVFLRLLWATAVITFLGFIALGIFGTLTVPLLLGIRALPIISFLPAYTLAMAYLTVASTIVSYHQVKKHYLLPYLSVVFAGLEVGLISLFHTDLQTVSSMILISSTAYLLTMTVMHFYHRQITFFAYTLWDFLGLFSSSDIREQAPASDKLRLLIFNWRDTRHVWAGGAEVYVQEIAKRWVAQGHSVTIFCGNDGHHPRREQIDGVQIVRRGGFYLVYLWACLYYLVRFRGKFDVVVDSANGVPFFTPLFVGVPTFLLIHHVHQNVFRENLPAPLAYIAVTIETKLMPWVYRKKEVITVSQSSKKDIIKSGLANASRITVISPGINEEDYTILPKTQHPTFLYLGRLKPYKNIDVLVQAFSQMLINHPTATLTIAGEGESMPVLQKLCATLQLQDKVHFQGKVTDKDKRRLLATSWVAVQPSSFEGWGITVLEANASGTPVIASNVNGLKDSVIYRKTGLLVPVKDVDAFATAMDSLIRLRSYRVLLARNAVTWARSFSWEKSASQFLDVIIEMIDQKDRYDMTVRRGLSLAGK